MLQVLERCELQTGSESSRIDFTTEGGGARPIWDRYLLVDKKRAYHIGNICQTCNFFFERLGGANTAVQVDKTADALQRGVSSLSDEVIEVLGKGLPQNLYLALLCETEVTLATPGSQMDYFVAEGPMLFGSDAFWDLPHDPRIAYYRGRQRELGSSAQLFHFIVPMFPENWLEKLVIAKYIQQFEEQKAPTAVAVSVLDVKAPAIFSGDPNPEITEHWCYTHYLIDGHHKVAAARRSGHPVRLLSFTSVKHGISTKEQIEQAIGASGRSL
jgi:hypothetical protein